MTQTLDEQLKELLPVVFKENKKVSAQAFWQRIEAHLGIITGEVYHSISDLYQQGYLGLESGSYIYRR